MSESAALALVEEPPRRSLTGLLKPVAPVKEVMAAQEAVRQYVKQTLQEGRDYGVIPGVDKPSLLKPGAERALAGFGLTTHFEVVEKEIDHTGEYPWIKRKKVWDANVRGKYEWDEERGISYGLYRYVVRCDLIDRSTGVVVGSCVGSCSTLESKYCDRPRDSENTVLKMAQKRAMVGATLTTLGLSDMFTQDMEDAPRDQAAPRAAKRSIGSVLDEGETEVRRAEAGGAYRRAPVTKDGDVYMAFGKMKGTLLADLPVDEIEGAIRWAESKGKFAEFVAAARQHLKQRRSSDDGVVEDGPPPPDAEEQ